jgi:uncharacterized protein YndB with AHSA1/START domain
MTSDAERGELTYRRVHQAPRELLFDCMTQPGHLTRFWGPVGTTTPEDRIIVDLRPGGVFQTVMVNDADGSEYTMRAVYHVVDRPAVLAWTEQGSGMSVTLNGQDHNVAWEVLAPALKAFFHCPQGLEQRDGQWR